MKKFLLIMFTYLIGAVCYSQTVFSEPHIIDSNTGNEPYEIESGDLDNDGDIDLVMATYDYNGGTPNQDYIKWYANDGAGNFTLQTTVSSTIQWVDGLAVADLDGQNGDDIIATSVNQNKLVYFPSDGAGGFGAEILIASITGPSEVKAGDINMDGNTDIVVVSYSEGKTRWFSGDGTGNFTAESDVESGSGNGPLIVDIGDFDGDTDLDVVVGFYNSKSVEIFYNQYIESGTMTVSWIQDTVTVFVEAASSYMLQVGFADVNNDGTMDVVKLDNLNGKVEWFNKIKNGTSTAYTISNNTIIARPGKMHVTDIDEDSLNDVIVTDSGSANNAVIWFKGISNAAPNSTPNLLPDSNHQIFDITVADFDGDFDMDIAYPGNFNDSVNWYENLLETLGSNENFKKQTSIYPNPAQSELHLKNNENQDFEVKVYNMMGQQVLTSNISSAKTLNVSSLSNGIYVLSIPELSLKQRFVKN